MTHSPDDVLRLTSPTKGFLCPTSANDSYGVEFLSFQLSDDETKETIFEIGTTESKLPTTTTTGSFPRDVVAADETDRDSDSSENDEHSGGHAIRYTFREDVLRAPRISSSLTFKVGEEKAVPSLRLIEKHYFRGRLIKSYDFVFGFCIPGSVNSWDAVYDVPPLDGDLVKEMIASPFETTSDSFYFVGDSLIMHNKAMYEYVS